MKLWRKMGNKVTLIGEDTPLTGRQYKANFPLWNFKVASNLMQSLTKKVPYDSSRYVKEEK